jgi:hypothetical protein
MKEVGLQIKLEARDYALLGARSAADLQVALEHRDAQASTRK